MDNQIPLNQDGLKAARYEMEKSSVRGDKLENAIRAYLEQTPTPPPLGQVEAVARAIEKALFYSHGFASSQPMTEAAHAAIKASGAEHIVGWQPIESAPRDGNRILGYIPYYKARGEVCGGAIVIMRWIVPDGEMNQQRRDLLKIHGGYWSCHHKGLQPLKKKPVFWMPLPLPPELRGK